MVKSSKEKRLLVLRLGTFVLKLGTDVGCQKVSRMIPHGKKRVAPIVLVRILTVRDTLALVTHLAMMYTDISY